MYMRVPLAAFAVNYNNKCRIVVTNLDIEQEDSSNVILGGMFFQEFFGAFTNTYNKTTGSVVAQDLELFIQLSSSWNASYIGDEMLPEGTNPFYTAPITPASSDNASVIWIIVLCVIIVLLAGFLGWAVYKWRKTAQETNDKRYIVYSTDEKEKPLNTGNGPNNFASDSEL